MKGRKNEQIRKTAIVIGGSSGIGRETALRLAARGAEVFSIARTASDAERVRPITADASREGELSKAIGNICAETGGLDLLVYSAGYDFLAPAERTESADARYLFEVNFFGAAEALRAAAPFLRARRGRAVFVSSMADETVIPYNAFYCAAQAALCIAGRAADAELRSRGVRVSAILPGGTATGFTYRRKVYGAEACGDAFAAVRRVEAALAHEEQGGMQPARVAEEIVRLSERRSPPAVKAAGGKNVLSRTAMRLVPARFADAFSRRKFAGRG